MAKERPAPPPRAVAIPSDRAWLDPPLVGSIQEVVISLVVVPMGQAVQLCAASLRRWSLVVIPLTLSGAFQIAPWSDVVDYPWSSATLSVPVGPLKLWDIGTLVGNRWWVYSSGGSTLRVVETLRKG